MSGLFARIEPLLPFVETPGQYTGAEVNAVVKDPAACALSFCLAYPDTYAVGMSHVGTKILYHVLNARPDICCERAFTPWTDMAELMRRDGVPAFSLENHRPLPDFDVVGFSLQFELNTTNVLLMLDLAGIPLRSEERGDEHPIILGGGSVALNPEPLAPFFDLFLLGEAEEAILELADLLIDCRNRGLSRKETLLRAARELHGVYAPAFYRPRYEGGRLAGLEPTEKGLPEKVRQRVVRNLDSAFFPIAQIVPNVSVVHDRLAVEIMRGCTRGCRFCQATNIYRPLRTRKPETVKRLVREGLAATGHSEVSLLSLTPGDYPDFVTMLRGLVRDLEDGLVNVSLPSLRVTPELIEIPEVVSTVRRSGLTFAPECATDRLRKRINKDVSNEELLAAAEAAFEAGWDTIKLYFMVGLPGETDEDVEAIPALIRNLADLRRKVRRRPGKVNVTVSCFVPKPHSAFQWAAMDPLDSLAAKQAAVLEPFRHSGGKVRVNVKTHDRFMSQMEALIARGDRRVADVIEAAYKAGEVFSAWDEHFDYSRWRDAAAGAGVDIKEAVHGERRLDEPLPWDFVESGVSRGYFEEEWRKMQAGEMTPDCRVEGCRDCGACDEDEWE